MTDFKPILQSRTVWAAAVAVLAGLAGLLHYSVSAADQSQIVDLAIAGVTVISGFGAIVGRVIATHQIGSAK